MEVISVGKRLKSIRKQLGIRQDEITGDLVTRNMISMIETDKASLTPKVAQIVTDQINDICEKRGINFKISVEALMESEEDQIKNNAVKLIEEIVAGTFNLNDERNKLVVLEHETKLAIDGEYDVAFSLDVACEDYFSEKNQYFEAYYYCKRSVDLSIHLIDDPRTFKAYNNISFYLLHLERYSEALYYCNLSLEKFYKMEPDDRYRVLMNKNIAASKLGNYELSTEIIDAMLKIEGLNAFELNKAWISKANRLADYGDWEAAVEIYKHIYIELRTLPQKYLILSNLIDIYIKINDLEHLQEVMNQALSELQMDDVSKNFFYLDKIFFKLSKAYLKLGQEDLFLEYNQKAYVCCAEQNLYKDLKDVLEFKIIYCCEKKNMVLINDVVNLLVELAEEKIVKREDNCVWQLMSYLVGMKDVKNLGKLTAYFSKI